MNEKYKNIIVFSAIIVIIALIIAMIVIVPKMSSKQEELKLEKYEIKNLDETSIELPNFKIDLVGAYEGEINKESVERIQIKAYEFFAGIDKSDGIETAKYVGYRLDEILNGDEIYEFSSLEFKNDEDLSSVLKSIDDKVYLVFRKNDMDINPTLLVVNKPYKKSIENINKIIITNDYTQMEVNETPEETE